MGYGPAQESHQPASPGTPSTDSRDPSQPAVVLVCFLGGVTYGEIAALRRLSELEDGRRKFLVLTTEVINTKKFFESLRCEQVFNQPQVETRKVQAQPKSRGAGLGGFWPGSR